MPKNELGGVPFPPLVKLDTDTPVMEETMVELLRQRSEGISLCIRSAEGHTNRGGYFFHIHSQDLSLEHCKVFNFEKIFVLEAI